MQRNFHSTIRGPELRRYLTLILAAILLAGPALASESAAGSQPAASGNRLLSFSAPRPLPVPPPSETEDTTSKSQSITLKLKSTKAKPDKSDASRSVEGAPMSTEAVTAVLKRLPALPARPVEELKLPAETLQPPKPGKVIVEAFPPPPTRRPKPAKTTLPPLKIVRYAPTGDIGEETSELRVKFSQPMVPLTAVSEVSKTKCVTLNPQPAGAWIWLDTSTVSFHPKDRKFPFATNYSATIPDTTKANSGSPLEGKGLTFKFSTPPVSLNSCQPEGECDKLDPTIILQFNQRISPAAVLPFITVQTRSISTGSKSQLRFPDHLALLNLDESKRLHSQRPDLKQESVKGQWLAFKTKAPLSKNTVYAVTLSKGCPSAEGPRKSVLNSTFEFKTFGPLRLLKSTPVKERTPVHTKDSVQLIFSNGLKESAFKQSMVTISPSVKEFEAKVKYHTIVLKGAFSPGAHYKITVSANLEDRYGQKLGQTGTESFNVVRYPHSFYYDNQRDVVLTPDMPTSLRVFSVNQTKLRIKAWAGCESLYEKFLDTHEKLTAALSSQKPFSTKDLALTPTNELQVTRVELKELLSKCSGNMLLLVEPTPPPPESYMPRGTYYYVQKSDFGLTPTGDASTVRVLATSLTDGHPLEGLIVKSASSSAKTGSTGMATLPAPLYSSDTTYSILSASDGKTTTFAKIPIGGWHGVNAADCSGTGITDRGLYLPGEEVAFKGWLRVITPGTAGDTWSPLDTYKTVDVQVTDPQGNKLHEAIIDLDRFGGFSGKFSIPKGANLGDANISFCGLSDSRARSQEQQIRFQIQEFRRPEFTVSVKARDASPVFTGMPVELETEAKYFTGGYLVDAPTEWVSQTTSAHFVPAGRSDFRFGIWRGYWWCAMPELSLNARETLKAATDQQGKDSALVSVERVDPPQPVNVETEVTVTDVNRQTFSDKNNVLIHPSSRYVGIKCERSFVDAKKPVNFESIVCDLDGKAVPGTTCELALVKRGPYKSDGTEDRARRKVVQTLNIVSKENPVRSTFTPQDADTYLVTAIVKDDRGRPNLTEVEVYAFGDYYSGGEAANKMEMNLTPDKELYNPGDTAEIAVSSPFEFSRGVLTVCRDGTVSESQFEFKGASYTLRIPIDEKLVPNVSAKVTLIGRVKNGKNVLACTTKSLEKSILLRISLNSRKLTVEPVPEKTSAEPGEETTVKVLVKNSDGKAVAGKQVTLVVADEAILALAGYTLPDMVSAFYPERQPGVHSYNCREQVQNVNLEEEKSTASQAVMPRNSVGLNENSYLAYGMPAPCPAGAGGAGWSSAPMFLGARTKSETEELAIPEAPPPPPPPAGEGPALKVRTNFNPLAVFETSAVTDSEGVASVKYKLPDNLTRYRIMALSTDENNKFGTGEASLTARLPVMAKPSPPRFLNFGDRCAIPIVVRNQTETDKEVNVVVRGTLKGLEQGVGKSVKVPAGDRTELSFPCEADYTGDALFQCAVVSDTASDAQTFSLPVYTPATSEAFAVYGSIGENSLCIAQPVKAPEEAYSQFGGLEVSTSSSIMQELTDAVAYVGNYQFECTEQLSSKILVLASLKEASSAFKLQSVDTLKTFDDRVNHAIKTIATRQTSTGNFGLWKKVEKETWPYLTCYATHALLVAKGKNYEVPEECLTNGLNYLAAIESHLDRKKFSDTERRAIIAYSLYVRALARDPNINRAITLLAEAPLEKTSPESIGFLLHVLSGNKKAEPQVSKIRAYLSNRMTETASRASFDGMYSENSYQLFYTPVKLDAILLSAVIKDSPDSDLVQKLLKSLMGSRNNGIWANTQENAFAALAVDRYFQTYEKTTPEFAARLWLGDTFAGKQDFVGRSLDTRSLQIPMSTFAGSGSKEFLISKDGPGRLYWRMGLKYAPRSLNLKPLDWGFDVQRTYEAVDNPADVTRDKEGVWHVKAGALVRVKLTMKLSGRRFHVALADPLPAGFEALNPDLKGTKTVSREETGDGQEGINEYGSQSEYTPFYWWSPYWWDHENLRDQRSEVFASVLWEGDYSYKYIARATTKGRFIVPPAKAEEMYEPETFGRTGTETVVVE